MPDIVGVRFKRAGRVYYFDPAGIPLEANECVVVETARGLEVGQVVIAPKQVAAAEVPQPLKPVVRKAAPEDIQRSDDLTSKEKEALAECNKLVIKLNLPMKLLKAEYNLEGTRCTIYFGSEERVDFRELVRQLTGVLHTRVELRQVGPRDEAKLLGGLGQCGRQLCCCSFLSGFNPVSIKMAKDQDLPLNPLKISGVCGRLLCCLVYENQQYREAKAKLPKHGQPVTTAAGAGIVTGTNSLKETVYVEMNETKAQVELPIAEVTFVPRPKPEPRPQAPKGQRGPRPDNRPSPPPPAPKAEEAKPPVQNIPPAGSVLATPDDIPEPAPPPDDDTPPAE